MVSSQGSDTMTARVLSFDIGIKNLAYCYWEVPVADPSGVTILDWRVVDLMSPGRPTEGALTVPVTCTCVLTSSTKKDPRVCGKKAKYRAPDTDISGGSGPISISYFCETHAKNHPTFLVPKKAHEPGSLHKLKREGLDRLMDQYQLVIPPSTTTKITKTVLVEALWGYFRTRSLVALATGGSAPSVNTKQIDLITIGRHIRDIMDTTPVLTTHPPTHIIMENQISTMASRMKTIQGELTMYFIMRFPGAHIEYISSANKLKHFRSAPSPSTDTSNEVRGVPVVPRPRVPPPPGVSPTASQTYRRHKQDAVACTETLLRDLPALTRWTSTLLGASKKRDDLADCFLQGLWYLWFSPVYANWSRTMESMVSS